jgi:hypothetical protein
VPHWIPPESVRARARDGLHALAALRIDVVFRSAHLVGGKWLFREGVGVLAASDYKKTVAELKGVTVDMLVVRDRVRAASTDWVHKSLFLLRTCRSQAFARLRARPTTFTAIWSGTGKRPRRRRRRYLSRHRMPR